MIGKGQEKTRQTSKRGVGFAYADIIEFEPTLYTTTVTSGGIPVGLSRKERKRQRRRLNSYEVERAPVRTNRQEYMEEGFMEPEEREMMLEAVGYKPISFDVAEYDIQKIIENRRESNELDYKYHFALGQANNIMDIEEETDNDDAYDVLNPLENMDATTSLLMTACSSSNQEESFVSTASLHTETLHLPLKDAPPKEPSLVNQSHASSTLSESTANFLLEWGTTVVTLSGDPQTLTV